MRLLSECDYMYNVFVKVQCDKNTECGTMEVVEELDNQFCQPD